MAESSFSSASVAAVVAIAAGAAGAMVFFNGVVVLLFAKRYCSYVVLMGIDAGEDGTESEFFFSVATNISMFDEGGLFGGGGLLCS